MDSKKLTIKRLIIFYILAILPLIGISAGLTIAFGEPAFASTNHDVLKWVSFTVAMGMFAPSIAHALTRLITKEGWKNTYLGYTAGKGNLKYYVFSVLYKPFEALIVVFIIWKVFLGDMSFSEVFNLEEPIIVISSLLFQLAGSVIIFFPAFGEEWGWRGYMMPKLFEIMPKPAAIVVGGILWGLWHAPLTVIGHNFGVDYPGFPFVGIGLMCAFCIAMNALLTFLTERTGSVYPAAFCHMINNNLSPAIAISILFTEKAYSAASEKLSAIPMSLILIGLALVPGIIFFILLVRKKKAE